MKKYNTVREQEIADIVVERAVAWGKEFMSLEVTSKDGITGDTAIESLLTQPDGSYDDSCRTDFLNDCEDNVFGSVSEENLDDISTIGQLIDKFIDMDKVAKKKPITDGINWTKIEEMPDHLRDGRDVLLHYDLGNLGDYHPRVIIGHWSKKLNVWVWQNRASRAYSDCYQPNYFAEINIPE